MQKENEDKGLVLIAIHRQDESLKGSVLALAASKGINYSITQQGSLTGDNSKGIPRAWVFDWKGQKVWEGHPTQMDSAIEPLVAKAPHWLTRGREFTDKAVAAQAQKLFANAGYAAIIKALADIVAKEVPADNAAAATKNEEAKFLHDSIVAHGTAKLAKAATNKKDAPLDAVTGYQELAVQFKGHEIGTKAKEESDGLKKDKAFQEELQAAKLYQAIQDEVGKMKPGAAITDKSNMAVVANIRAYAAQLFTKYPASNAAGKARQLATSLGIPTN